MISSGTTEARGRGGEGGGGVGGGESRIGGVTAAHESTKGIASGRAQGVGASIRLVFPCALAEGSAPQAAILRAPRAPAPPWFNEDVARKKETAIRSWPDGRFMQRLAEGGACAAVLLPFATGGCPRGRASEGPRHRFPGRMAIPPGSSLPALRVRPSRGSTVHRAPRGARSGWMRHATGLTCSTGVTTGIVESS